MSRAEVCMHEKSKQPNTSTCLRLNSSSPIVYLRLLFRHVFWISTGRVSNTISLHISIRRNHLSLWQNASQHSLSMMRNSAASYPVEAWDSVLRRLVVAGSAYIAGMPFDVAVQVSSRSLVPFRRLEACLLVELGSGRG